MTHQAAINEIPYLRCRSIGRVGVVNYNFPLAEEPLHSDSKDCQLLAMGEVVDETFKMRETLAPDEGFTAP